MTPTYFESASAFRAWLETHHATERELFVGFYKLGSGKRSLTHPEALDEALAFGWIDGVRKSVDAERYVQRFTPRRRGSIWSAANIRKVETLLEQGRMAPPGLQAFQGRERAKTRKYSYENRPRTLPPAYARVLRSDPRAWDFFRKQPPGYRRLATWWIVSAVREETRQKRLHRLVALCVKGKRLEAMSPGNPIPPIPE
jgi:uncharacterized protein YdeI (YjbR/CyaY-like superfamily)